MLLLVFQIGVYSKHLGQKFQTPYTSAASSLLSWLQQKKQERWEEAVNTIDFSHSNARRGEQSANLLAGLNAPLACAPSRQIPSPCNSWRTGHTRQAGASLPGSSANSCPTYGRFQHLRVTVSLNPSGRKTLLLPSDAGNQESLQDWIPSSQCLYSTPGRLSNLGSATSSIPTCTISKFQRSGEEH